MSNTPTMSIDNIADVLREMGFRAELVPASNGGKKSIRSAAAGVGFNIIAGNESGDGLLDMTFFTSFRFDQPLPGLPDVWNRGRRFARVYTRDDGIGMEMDVLLAGGVTPAYVRANVEIWNRLLNELLSLIKAQAAAVADEKPEEKR